MTAAHLDEGGDDMSGCGSLAAIGAVDASALPGLRAATDDRSIHL
jgi:hypothetical protein